MSSYLVPSPGGYKVESAAAMQAVAQTNRINLLYRTLTEAVDALAVSEHDLVKLFGVSEGVFFSPGLIVPTSQRERDRLLKVIAQDGLYLIEKIDSSLQVDSLSKLPAVSTLRRVWKEHCSARVLR